MKRDVRYVIEDMDRHGNVRVYFRKRGCRKVRLPSPNGSAEFWQAYNAALANAAPVLKQELVRRPAPGTLRALVIGYYSCAEFTRLDDRVQYVRRLTLDRLCAVHGDLPAKKMLPRHIRLLRDEKAATPEAANQLVKFLRQVFTHGIAVESCDRNPARDVPYLASNNPDGFHTWTLGEVEQYEATHPIGTKARLAMALLLFVAQRRSDVVLFGKQHAQKGWLIFTQFKNRKKKPIRLAVPIRPELQTIIDASPCGELTYLVTEFGKPFTANGFGNKFRDWCDQANLRHCSAHGLRKAAAARLAELGASEKEIMAITGHTTSKEITRYTKGAQQRLLATHAMARHAKPEGGE